MLKLFRSFLTSLSICSASRSSHLVTFWIIRKNRNISKTYSHRMVFRRKRNYLKINYYFGATHIKVVGAKRPLLKICHTFTKMIKHATVIPYLKKVQKMYDSRDTRLEFCWHHDFSPENQQILLYQEIQIYIAFWCIISSSFNFSWVFEDCFNKHGCNYYDVSKNGYSRPS